MDTNNQNSKPEIRSKVEESLKTFSEKYAIISKLSIRSWKAWLIIGLVAGVLGGAIYVANKNVARLESEQSEAAGLLSYPYTKGLLKFPQDEGNHRDQNVEWWYANFNVVDKIRQPFRGFIALARLNFPNTSSGLLIIGLTDINNKLFWHKIYQGNIISYKDRLNLFFNDSDNIINISWKQIRAFAYQLNIVSEEITTKLTMSSIKYPLVEGSDGLVPIGSGVDSYYYSLTALNASAPSINLKLFGIEALKEGIIGSAWMDHQWFNIPDSIIGNLSSIKPKHEWFSVQLSNGTELIAWDISGTDKKYKYLGILNNNESQSDTELLNISPLNYWVAQDGKKYANSWRVLSEKESGLNLDIVITTQIPDQQIRGSIKINGSDIDTTFYEGGVYINGVLNSKNVSGSGYAEMSRTY